MPTRKSLLKNTLLLTISSLAIRFIGISWQVWLADKIGDAGIGLYHLILSIGTLAITISVSGIRYATTRLVSESLDKQDCIKPIIKRCLIYGLVFGTSSFLLLYLNASPLAFLWLGDVRAVPSLQIFALSLPACAVTTVLGGYFTAVGRVWKSVAVQISREFLVISLTVVFLRGYICGNIKEACVAIFSGSVIADYVALFILIFFFVRDISQYPAHSGEPTQNFGSVLHIALPIAIASYAKSGLSTLQHMLVPKGLKHAGLSADNSLALYGIVQGMALPLILFPSCLMTALSEMIVPALTCEQSKNDTLSARKLTQSILEKSFIYAAGVASIFFFFGDSMGKILYDSQEAGAFIKIFSAIVPIMYMDMVTDGCLKGLGEMMFCMYVNIADAGLSALLVWLLLPAFGINAYVGIICFTECFNFLLSIIYLRKKTGFTIYPFFYLKISLYAVISAFAAKALFTAISAGNSVPALIISIVLSFVIYAVFALSALRRQ